MRRSERLSSTRSLGQISLRSFAYVCRRISGHLEARLQRLLDFGGQRKPFSGIVYATPGTFPVALPKPWLSSAVGTVVQAGNATRPVAVELRLFFDLLVLCDWFTEA